MMDNDNILETTGRGRLTADVTYLMLKGAGYAMAGCLAVLLTVLVLAAIGRALPEESRDTPDPVNRSSLEILLPVGPTTA